MDLILIRHADAEARPSSPADGDMGRCLTPKGVEIARLVFFRLQAAGKMPERIVSSEAVRAVQTATLLADAGGGIPRMTDPALNPGCGPDDLQRVLSANSDIKRLAVVGHQPDLSVLISHWVADGRLCLTMKKCACACIRLAPGKQRGELCWLAPPALLGSVKGD